MCLTIITSLNPVPKKGRGYKIFTVKASRFRILYRSIYSYSYRKYRIGGRYKDKLKYYLPSDVSDWWPEEEYAETPLEYMTGFHIYETLEDASSAWERLSPVCFDARIVEVKYDKAVAKGKEGWPGQSRRVVVARRMKLVREVY